MNHRRRILVSVLALSAAVIAGVSSSIAQTQTSTSDAEVKARPQGIVKGILSIWDRFDVVCLGEDHGRKNDSDLRIALIEHQDFIRKVDIIIVEFADILQQDILDRTAKKQVAHPLSRRAHSTGLSRTLNPAATGVGE